MTQFAFNRDNILNSEERLTSAKKCLKNIEDRIEEMTSKESSFITEIIDRISNGATEISERQLAWSRDLNEKY